MATRALIGSAALCSDLRQFGSREFTERRRQGFISTGGQLIETGKAGFPPETLRNRRFDYSAQQRVTTLP
ncbi:hypothetical protein FHS38_005859 [Streptomyces netropsis]|uniref:Uncharacterized protein n=1 Tax=Streptomyces netropsis TaxID=55404 RepID=A0A7W7LHH9_STRNE|nr:hypothetical protein [Streptomyces netropsis]GGR41082.1 hypothetical protein GCM10010219_52860 [Streptomyces netropsis]